MWFGSRGSALAALVATACAAGVLGWALAAIDRETGMHLDQPCGTCHLSKTEITPEHAGKLVAAQERLCVRCHERAMEASHPSGFRPTATPPQAFPLDWKGDLTCSTCHDIHGSPGHSMRVEERGRDLCLSCHDQAFFARMRDGGQSLMVSGHLDASSQRFRDLDPYSLQCMGCHVDQATAKNVSVDPFGVMRHASGSANHPIGMRYAESVGYGGYRPQSALPEEIILPDGKVGCVSCHDGYSQTHGKVLGGGGDLCFICHDM